jgi:phage terminase small subunit
MAQGLTNKQERFCDNFVKCDSASDAYRLAYDVSRMTDKSVWEKASELMRNVKVTTRIAELRSLSASKAQKSRDDIAARLNDIIDADPTDYINPATGRICASAIKKMPKSKRVLIEGIKESSKGVVELTLSNKSKAIERYCRMMGYDAEDRARELEVKQQREYMQAMVEAMSPERRAMLADIASEFHKTAPDAL